MSKCITNILLVGMGGQGIVTASRVIGTASLLEGHDVKTTEVHGMAQRGGTVDAHIRFGIQVHSPIIPVGEADILVALEELEAIRWAHFVRPDGLVLLNPERRVPVSADRKKDDLPRREVLEGKQFYLEVVKPSHARNFRQANIFMLGRLSLDLDINDSNWKKALEMVLKPSTFDKAYKEFLEGRNLLRGKREAVTA